MPRSSLVSILSQNSIYCVVLLSITNAILSIQSHSIFINLVSQAKLISHFHGCLSCTAATIVLETAMGEKKAAKINKQRHGEFTSKDGISGKPD